MPLQTGTLDDRTYQDLLDEARARIPVHTPEWTNFNKSDPGITLLELFAFLTESLLYRVNQVPDRNRRKFLSLLGVPLRPATAARGLVAFTNEKGPADPVQLAAGLELRAGAVPFRTEQGLEVLPVEARVYCKRPRELNPAERAYYTMLYASFLPPGAGTDLRLYETVPLPPEGIDLGSETIDVSVWVALLVRQADKPPGSPPDWDLARAAVRRRLAGRILNLGVVPRVEDEGRILSPAGHPASDSQTLLQVQIPKLPTAGLLPSDPGGRVARYQSLVVAFPDRSVLAEPGVVQVTLPADPLELGLWANLLPQEGGTGDFPPSLDDTTLADRLVTWLRVTPRDPDTARPVKLKVGLMWVGVNAATVTQRDTADEPLPDGTGEPDQAATLSRAPVLPGSVRVTVAAGKTVEDWAEIDDLGHAGPEVPVPDPRVAPSRPAAKPGPAKVFALDAEAGRLTFGSGDRGARPPFGAKLRARYDFAAGAAGNVGADQIGVGPQVPAGLQVSNPVRTWGGSAAETTAEGERQVTRFLQHRDRLVTAADFETIALRTPGADLARVDVIPAYAPDLGRAANAGDAPGAVTLMIVPRWGRDHPDTPDPDPHVLAAVCDYLDPRRLVTTEVYLRGPVYKPVWVSVGVRVAGGKAIAPVVEAVRRAVRVFLSPLPHAGAGPDDPARNGWPRGKPVVAMELLAVASRVPGVVLVTGVQIAADGRPAGDLIDMAGLELPRLAGLAVGAGDPIPVDQLRGQDEGPTPPSDFLPVPAVPEEC